MLYWNEKRGGVRKMRNIPAAKGSPRIENGVILFTEGDTFDLKIHLKFH